MMPYRYNGGFTIWQAPGVVVFDLEMIHDARVILTDGRPPLTSAHKGYMGDSRGRWEGNTLVIETTNYKGGHAPMINLAVVGSPAGNRFPHSDQMKTTERITRLNDDMWLYEIKTEDPVILTGSFTVRYPMRNDPNYEWWEYACHEGNTIVPNYTLDVAARACEPGAVAGTAGRHGGRQEPADQGARPCRHREGAGWTLGRTAGAQDDGLRHRHRVHGEAGRRSRRETGRDHAARSARSADQQVAHHHGSRRHGEGLHDQRPPADLHVPEHPAVEFRGRAVG